MASNFGILRYKIDFRIAIFFGLYVQLYVKTKKNGNPKIDFTWENFQKKGDFQIWFFQFIKTLGFRCSEDIDEEDYACEKL